MKYGYQPSGNRLRLVSEGRDAQSVSDKRDICVTKEEDRIHLEISLDELLRLALK